MQVEILTPDQNVYQGEAKGVQLPGVEGLFEILENHAPIVAALKEGSIKVTGNDGKAEEISISGGFVECLNNKVIVLVEKVLEAA